MPKNKLQDTDPEFNKLVALSAWQRVFEAELTMAKFAIDFALLAIRSALLTNAGALAAFLGWLSSNKNSEKFAGTIVLHLGWGLFLAMVAAGFAYLSQIAFSQIYKSYKKTQEPPFYKLTDESNNARAIGNVFRGLTALALLGSYILLFAAGYVFYTHLSN